MKAKLDKICLIESVGYLYRQRSSSTVHNHNAQSLKDRVYIEECHLMDAKEKGIYEKYKEAFEYIYTVRRSFSTIKIYLKCGDSIYRDNIYHLIKSLKKQFPNWKRNSYYKEITAKQAKIKNKIICVLPGGVILLVSIYKKIMCFKFRKV